MIAWLIPLTALRLVIAAAIPLAPDEAYYWIWSKALAPGYLDHPPMVALWIRAGTALAGDTALGVRLLAPLAAALGSVLLARAAEDLLPGRRAGAWAAGLLNATLAFGVGAVTMTPDTPLLLFWTAGLWALARLHRTGRRAWWLVFGLAAGCALGSKYTALFLPAGAALWVLACAPRSLRGPWPWAGAALTAGLFLPVVAWNADHGWVSFAKQGGRTAAWDTTRAVRYVSELVGSQIGLVTPLVWAICTAGVVAAAARARPRDPAWTLLAALTVPPALVFLQHALGDRVQGNWPAIIYPAAAIAGAALGGVWARLRVPAVALGGALTALVYVQATAAPLRLSIYTDPTLLRLAGWGEAASAIAALATADGADFIAADGYDVASELAWHLSAPPVVGVDPRWALFALPAAPAEGRSGVLVRSARRGDDIDLTPWTGMVPIGTVIRARDGVFAEEFHLFRVTFRPGGTPSALLAHRTPR